MANVELRNQLYGDLYGNAHRATRSMHVAFQGETGAFSEEAVEAFFGDEADPVGCDSFEDVFTALADGDVERAVIPIENSLHGSVHANYDLLRRHAVQIIGERWIRIRHFLMARSGVGGLQAIERVRSHPQALGQCRAFLRERLPQAEAVPAYDTAGAAREVAASGDDRVAAIASRRAAAEYGLAVLAEGIESNEENYTRFLVLCRRSEAPEAPTGKQPHKTSLVFSLKKNVPGALFKSLAVFALRELDLFKIESRPLVGTPGQYVFYLDVEGSAQGEPVRRALDHLREVTDEARVLGSYPVD